MNRSACPLTMVGMATADGSLRLARREGRLSHMEGRPRDSRGGHRWQSGHDRRSRVGGGQRHRKPGFARIYVGGLRVRGRRFGRHRALLLHKKRLFLFVERPRDHAALLSHAPSRAPSRLFFFARLLGPCTGGGHRESPPPAKGERGGGAPRVSSNHPPPGGPRWLPKKGNIFACRGRGPPPQ